MSDGYEEVEVEIYEQADGTFVDIDGNPVDENGDPLHTVDDPAPAPAAQPPADGGGAEQKVGKAPKLLIAGAAVAALLVGGGLAYGLSAVGDQNTVSDVKDAASAKSSQARAAVSSKKSEVVSDVDACTASGLGSAMVSGSGTPAMQLDVLSSAPLPAAFVEAQTNADGVTGQLGLLQLSKNTWGAYAEVLLTRAEKKARVDKAGWWKADVTVDGDKVAVTGDQAWPGGDDAGAGSCQPGAAGVYAVTGKVPTDAAGLVDGQAQVDAIQGVAGSETRALAVMGDSVVLVELAEVPDADDHE
ncbi:hypothetical protein [Gordonia alkaliphila]|uniref:Uncharacterized protein n=1 Tax=Gordonia alkaliphila TaxID=1053547 RepID=A0ABP8YZP9_9ACTN